MDRPVVSSHCGRCGAALIPDVSCLVCGARSWVTIANSAAAEVGMRLKPEAEAAIMATERDGVTHGKGRKG